MARTGSTQAVRGYREFLRACDRADRATKRETRKAFREVGDIVRVEATSRFVHTDPKSARGYRTRVRQRGVAVEQSLRRTTGRHPEFGALNMTRALIPALDEKTPQVERAMESAVDRVADAFTR